MVPERSDPTASTEYAREWWDHQKAGWEDDFVLEVDELVTDIVKRDYSVEVSALINRARDA